VADYGLKANFLGDASYSPSLGSWGYNGTLAAGQNLAAIIRVNKEIVGKKNLNTRYENYSLGIQQLILLSKISAVQLKKAVTEQYINTYAAEQKLAITQDIVKLLEQEDVLLKKLTQKVTFKQTDYLSFKVNLQQNIIVMEQQKADWLNHFSALQFLLGKILTKSKHLEKPNIVEISQMSYEESLYAQSYQTDKEKLKNDAQIIQLDYQPKFSVYADGGYSSALTSSPYKNWGTSVGLSVNIPIYDGHKKKMILQQNQLSQETLQGYNEFKKKQFQIQIEQISEQIVQNQHLLKMAKEQIIYSKTLIDANLKQLPTGDVHMTDFILSINNYISLQLGIIGYETTIDQLKNHLQNLTLP
jgi:outer membrane protein TolC